MNVLVAHNKGENPSRIQHVIDWLQTQLSDAHIVTGEQDWAARFAQAGGWTAWAQDVGAGVDVSGRPRYELIVVPSMIIGRATMQIVNAALGAGKLVVFHNPADDDVTPVVRVEPVDTDSWKAGWRLVLPPL